MSNNRETAISAFWAATSDEELVAAQAAYDAALDAEEARPKGTRPLFCRSYARLAWGALPTTILSSKPFWTYFGTTLLPIRLRFRHGRTASASSGTYRYSVNRSNVSPRNTGRPEQPRIRSSDRMAARCKCRRSTHRAEVFKSSVGRARRPLHTRETRRPDMA